MVDCRHLFQPVSYLFTSSTAKISDPTFRKNSIFIIIITHVYLLYKDNIAMYRESKHEDNAKIIQNIVKNA